MTETKVVFAEEEVTVHKVLEGATNSFESVTLLPGESVALTAIAPYQAEAVTAGKIPGLVLVTPTKAKTKEAEALRRRGEASIESRLVQKTVSNEGIETTEEVVPAVEAFEADDE